MRNKRAIVLTRDSATYQLPKLEGYFQKMPLTGVFFYQFQPTVTHLWGSSSDVRRMKFVDDRIKNKYR